MTSIVQCNQYSPEVQILLHPHPQAKGPKAPPLVIPILFLTHERATTHPCHNQEATVIFILQCSQCSLPVHRVQILTILTVVLTQRHPHSIFRQIKRQQMGVSQSLSSIFPLPKLQVLVTGSNPHPCYKTSVKTLFQVCQKPITVINIHPCLIFLTNLAQLMMQSF